MDTTTTYQRIVMGNKTDNLRVRGLWSKGLLLVAEAVEAMRSKAKKRSFKRREIRILLGDAMFFNKLLEVAQGLTLFTYI